MISENAPPPRQIKKKINSQSEVLLFIIQLAIDYAHRNKNYYFVDIFKKKTPDILFRIFIDLRRWWWGIFFSPEEGSFFFLLCFFLLFLIFFFVSGFLFVQGFLCGYCFLFCFWDLFFGFLCFSISFFITLQFKHSTNPKKDRY